MPPKTTKKGMAAPNIASGAVKLIHRCTLLKTEFRKPI